jgi:hypothetical protein
MAFLVDIGHIDGDVMLSWQREGERLWVKITLLYKRKQWLVQKISFF